MLSVSVVDLLKKWTANLAHNQKVYVPHLKTSRLDKQKQYKLTAVHSLLPGIPRPSGEDREDTLYHDITMECLKLQLFPLNMKSCRCWDKLAIPRNARASLQVVVTKKTGEKHKQMIKLLFQSNSKASTYKSSSVILSPSQEGHHHMETSVESKMLKITFWHFQALFRPIKNAASIRERS